MGLDSVELVMESEETFGVKLEGNKVKCTEDSKFVDDFGID